MQLKLLQKESFKKQQKQLVSDLIGNKIADKITSVLKKSPKELQNDEMEAPKKRYISLGERQQIKQYNNGISKNSKFVTQ